MFMQHAVTYIALQRAKVPVELHIVGNVSHDFAVRKDTKPTASWMELCLQWLHDYQLLDLDPAGS